MSEHLDRLHAAARRRGQSDAASAAAWVAYKAYARRVADGLLFPYLPHVPVWSVCAV